MPVLSKRSCNWRLFLVALACWIFLLKTCSELTETSGVLMPACERLIFRFFRVEHITLDKG